MLLVLLNWCIIFENLEAGWTSWFSGTQKKKTRDGIVPIVESLQQSGNAFLCYNWNVAYSSANTFSLERLIIIFNGHTLGTIDKSITHSFLLSLTQYLMLSWQNQTPRSTLLVKGNFFVSLSVEAEVPCLPTPTLTYHNFHVMACIAQHLLAKLGGNLTMCHWGLGSWISNIDMECVTPCPA